AFNSAGGVSGGVNAAGTVHIFNSTVFGNDYGIGFLGGNVDTTNTMVVNNSGPVAGDCAGGGPTSNHSFDSDGSCGMDLGSHAPHLAPLAANGGSTLSLRPLPGSFAINHGTNTPCPTIDQRYASRPATAVDPCDIGSIEVDGTPPVVTPPANQT